MRIRDSRPEVPKGQESGPQTPLGRAFLVFVLTVHMANPLLRTSGLRALECVFIEKPFLRWCRAGRGETPAEAQPLQTTSPHSRRIEAADVRCSWSEMMSLLPISVPASSRTICPRPSLSCACPCRGLPGFSSKLLCGVSCALWPPCRLCRGRLLSSNCPVAAGLFLETSWGILPI